MQSVQSFLLAATMGACLGLAFSQFAFPGIGLGAGLGTGFGLGLGGNQGNLALGGLAPLANQYGLGAISPSAAGAGWGQPVQPVQQGWGQPPVQQSWGPKTQLHPVQLYKPETQINYRPIQLLVPQNKVELKPVQLYSPLQQQNVGWGAQQAAVPQTVPVNVATPQNVVGAASVQTPVASAAAAPAAAASVPVQSPSVSYT